MIGTINEQNPQRSRKEIEAHLVAKAWKDEAFKQQLLANPQATIEQEFGVQLPEQLNVRVMEEDTDILYITLPARHDFQEELSEQELEAIAGGRKKYDYSFDGAVEASIDAVDKELSSW